MGKYDKWLMKYPKTLYTDGYENFMERDAYWFQIKMGAGSAAGEGAVDYYHYKR